MNRQENGATPSGRTTRRAVFKRVLLVCVAGLLICGLTGASYLDELKQDGTPVTREEFNKLVEAVTALEKKATEAETQERFAKPGEKRHMADLERRLANCELKVRIMNLKLQELGRSAPLPVRHTAPKQTPTPTKPEVIRPTLER